MKISSKRKYLALTLAEMMISVGCGTLILAAILSAGISLQKSYAALEGYSSAEGDQLRVLDYIAMDCRRAASATVNSITYTNNGVSVNESQLVLSVPPFYSSSTNLPTGPTISSGAASYGTDIITITYEQQGSNFTREVKVTDSTGTTTRSDVTTAIAKNVSSFDVSPSDLTTKVSCSIMFFPNFLRNSGTGTWRSGQYTPNDQAPLDTLGSNGDWYVINGTASTASTVGDVYFKSGGTYSKIQNVKATTVAINTFLRNASARQ